MRSALPSMESGTSRRRALLCLSICMLLASLGTSIANIALPGLTRVFDAPFDSVKWIVVSYLAALTLFTILAGWLGDMYGRRRMLIVGLFVFIAASVSCGLASDLWVLIGARAVQGAGAAFLFTLTIALVRDTAEDDRVGRAMGLLGTMSAVGTALGPSLGGVMIGGLGWRSIFLILAPIGMMAALLAPRSLPGGRSETLSSKLPFAALRTAGIAPNLITNLLVAAVMMTTLIVGPFYLGLALGLPEAMVGLVMAVGPAISIFGGVPSGQLVDRWGARRVIGLGLIALACGGFALSVLPNSFGVAGYVASIIILTPGYQMFQAANNTSAMAGVPTDRRGMVSGLLSLARNIGLVVGASAMGAVFAFGTGTDAVESATPAEISNGMQLTFIVAGAMMAVAIGITRRRSTSTGKSQPAPDAGS